MDNNEIFQTFLDKILPIAIEEDLQSGDITTDATIPVGQKGVARIEAKEEMIVCGVPLAVEIFKRAEGKIDLITIHAKDGDQLIRGSQIIEIEAELSLLLKQERIVLNMMQRLSGIASKTNQYVAALKGSKTQLLDTRKTLPGFRLLEKYAVKIGGGVNHRMGLYDMYLIKDNHIAATGSVTSAIRMASKHRQEAGTNHRIEIECKTLEQVEEAAKAGVEIIMLDNMDDMRVRKAVEIIDRRSKVEVSGNITQGRLPGLARIGVDYVSSGALTHSVNAKDISMNIKAKI